ncbi:hypothetical protein KTC96_13505 [Clostridium estertheticum]|nr:hypothetical protein [Clostridium estertheticum]MBX4262147.1 hypothetical protein [Clostridium estertheticum]WLC69016.1 hypothetical protein KTC96_13505 [Clostridium estertheticum]
MVMIRMATIDDIDSLVKLRIKLERFLLCTQIMRLDMTQFGKKRCLRLK